MNLKNLVFILFFYGIIACANKHDESRAEISVNNAVDSCNYLDVDTSVAGINLYDVESFLKIAGSGNKFCEGETYCLASKDGYQELKLTVHPGNSEGSICEFEIINTRLTGSKQKKLFVDSFVTGKGIFIGMPKDELIQKMGICYSANSKTKNEILRYKISAPKDTKNKLLQRLNYPVYYAEYKLNDDGYVANIRFGLEYP